jgi:hypothetical protein
MKGFIWDEGAISEWPRNALPGKLRQQELKAI